MDYKKMKAKDLAKKYAYFVRWSVADKCYIARAIEWPSLECHSNSMVGALNEMLGLVEICIKDMRIEKESYPKPMSLHFNK